MEMQIIKLLNEFENEKTDTNIRYWDYYQNGFHYLEYGQTYSELLMISKKYEFIKWLVRNNKVDADGLNYKYMDAVYELELAGILKKENRAQYLSDFLIMLLSISDTPIDDLISYLK